MQHVTGFTGPAIIYTDGALGTIRPDVVDTARSLVEIAAEGTHFQVLPPRHGLAGHTSDPQHLALTVAAEHGRVLRGGRTGEAPVRVLVALARRGLLTLTAFSGPRRTNWAYGVLTDAGRRELARLDAEHAERVAFETARDRTLAAVAGRVS